MSLQKHSDQVEATAKSKQLCGSRRQRAIGARLLLHRDLLNMNSHVTLANLELAM